MGLTAAAIAWAQSRGLSQTTLERMDVRSGTGAYFPDLERKTEAIFFGYRGGWKARALEAKSFVFSKGLKLSFWNEDLVLQSNLDTVFFTEGCIDALSLVEAGISPDQVLSVPNGARARTAETPGDLRGYAYVEEALKAGLSRAKRFVWCGDTDEPGLALRADMARILGAARFNFVEWPEGCKDANDYLRSEGPQALHELVTQGSLPWPVDGLYRISELPEPPPLTLWHPGFPEWESKLLLAPKCLSVFTGQPGNGKTLLANQLWFQVAKTYDLVVFSATFETRPKPHIRRQLRSLLSGKLESNMDDIERAKADAWINDHYFFAAHPEQRQTLEWLLDLAEVAVVRHGAKIVMLDPWNRIEGARTRDESETDYIGRCLRTMHVFAQDMNCHFQIIAHPAKMDQQRRGKPPELEDISSSKHWENMVDQGFVIHRPEIFDGTNRKTEASLYHRKARFEELGYPCKLNLNYDLATGRYKSADYVL